jgi:hypothetical protein
LQFYESPRAPAGGSILKAPPLSDLRPGPGFALFAGLPSKNSLRLECRPSGATLMLSGLLFGVRSLRPVTALSAPPCSASGNFTAFSTRRCAFRRHAPFGPPTSSRLCARYAAPRPLHYCPLRTDVLCSRRKHSGCCALHRPKHPAAGSAPFQGLPCAIFASLKICVPQALRSWAPGFKSVFALPGIRLTPAIPGSRYR